jgi:hypothetical protein
MSDQLSMFEVPETLPFQAHSGTSREAAGDMRGIAVSKRAAVLMVIEQSTHGRTDEEIQRMLKLNPSTQRPRRIELVQAGKVRDSGRTRKTKGGRAATVWEVVPT